MAEYKNPAMRPGRWEEYQKGLAGRGPADADLWTAQNFPEFMTTAARPMERLQTTQVGSAPRGGGGGMPGMEYLNERNPLRRRKPARASFGSGGSSFRGMGGGFGGGGWSMGG